MIALSTTIASMFFFFNVIEKNSPCNALEHLDSFVRMDLLYASYWNIWSLLYGWTYCMQVIGTFGVFCKDGPIVCKLLEHLESFVRMDLLYASYWNIWSLL